MSEEENAPDTDYVTGYLLWVNVRDDYIKYNCTKSVDVHV